MAFTGHSGTQTAQSMHSSGSMTRKFGPSRNASTGQTSTQSVYLHRMQASVTTKVIVHGARGQPQQAPPEQQESPRAMGCALAASAVRAIWMRQTDGPASST